MLFSQSIDSLAASGAIMGSVWSETSMPVMDRLGEEFLETVKTGDSVTVLNDGIVQIG